MHIYIKYRHGSLLCHSRVAMLCDIMQLLRHGGKERREKKGKGKKREKGKEKKEKMKEKKEEKEERRVWFVSYWDRRTTKQANYASE